MPATFQASIPSITVFGITNVLLNADAENNAVTMTGLFADATGKQIPSEVQTVQMTPAAFFTAMQAASGSWKN